MNSFSGGKCFICQNDAELSQNLDDTYRCSQCGNYVVSHSGLLNFEEELRPIISGYIRESQSREYFVLTQEVIDTIRTMPIPTVAEKVQRLMLWFASKTSVPGKFVKSIYDYKELVSTCYATDNSEIALFIDHIKEKGYIAGQQGDLYSFKITVDGFNYIESIRSTIKSNLCFCAMSFDKRHSYIYETFIKPAVEQSGFDIRRVDEAPHNDGIVDQIIALIRQSKFVIADLSGNKDGVYYEAGFAKGLGRPVIFTCEEAYFEDIHFDVKHLNFLKWKEDEISDAIERLAWKVQATLGRGVNN